MAAACSTSPLDGAVATPRACRCLWSRTVSRTAGRADAPFTFVSEGVESAMAQASHVAGEKTIGVARASITQQCLRAGLLGEIVVALVPVLFGAGIHFFGHLGGTPIMGYGQDTCKSRLRHEVASVAVRRKDLTQGTALGALPGQAT